MQVNLFPEGTMNTASKGRAVAAADLLRAADERARRTICEITDPPMIRKRFEHAGILSRLHHARREDGPRGICSFLRDLADLAACGVPEHQVRALALQVGEFVDALFPAHTTPLEELDLAEAQLEGTENLITTRRLVREALSPDELDRAAEVDRRHAAVQLSRARALSHHAGRNRFAVAQAGRA
jgi:hypothetical protein